MVLLASSDGQGMEKQSWCTGLLLERRAVLCQHLCVAEQRPVFEGKGKAVSTGTCWSISCGVA